MGSRLEISPRPPWVDALHGYVRPYWDELLEGDWAEGVANTRLTIPEMQGWILQIYPFIHAFPKFLAEALTNVEDDFSRGFLIDNIRVEKASRKVIHNVGHVMGKQTIAEFVDSAKVMKALRAIGVDFAQGYWVAKPAPFEPRLKKVAASAS